MMDVVKHTAALLAFQSGIKAETTEDMIAHAKLWEAYLRSDGDELSDPANEVGSDMDEIDRHLESLGFGPPHETSDAVSIANGHASIFGIWPIEPIEPAADEGSGP